MKFIILSERKPCKNARLEEITFSNSWENIQGRKKEVWAIEINSLDDFTCLYKDLKRHSPKDAIAGIILLNSEVKK